MFTNDPAVEKFIIGVLGAVIGVVVREILGYLGSVRCVVSNFTWENGTEDSSTEDSDTNYFRYTFYVEVFNERRVGTGLRDVDVVFLDKESREPIIDRPRDDWTVVCTSTN